MDATAMEVARGRVFGFSLFPHLPVHIVPEARKETVRVFVVSVCENEYEAADIETDWMMGMFAH
eukprot:11031695-Lingulodinium_polyedra.AAC.1